MTSAKNGNERTLHYRDSISRGRSRVLSYSLMEGTTPFSQMEMRASNLLKISNAVVVFLISASKCIRSEIFVDIKISCSVWLRIKVVVVTLLHVIKAPRCFPQLGKSDELRSFLFFVVYEDYE